MIAALLSCRTVKEAAAQCHVCERSILRWLADDAEFAKQYSAARAALLRATTNRLLMAGDGAAKTLQVVSNDSGAPAGARVMAAARMIELGRSGFTLEELEKRLVELERSFAKEGQ